MSDDSDSSIVDSVVDDDVVSSLINGLLDVVISAIPSDWSCRFPTNVKLTFCTPASCSSWINFAILSWGDKRRRRLRLRRCCFGLLGCVFAAVAQSGAFGVLNVVVPKMSSLSVSSSSTVSAQKLECKWAGRLLLLFTLSSLSSSDWWDCCCCWFLMSEL